MSFRFQKRFKIAPGLTINIGKRGLSASVGPKGAKVTIGNGRRRVSAGIPGTGMSWSESWRTDRGAQLQHEPPRRGLQPATIVVLTLLAIFLLALALDKFGR